MKRIIVAIFAVLLLAGCSLGGSDERAEQDREAVKALQERVEKLEKETRALKRGLAEALGGIAAIEKGLAGLEGKAPEAGGDTSAQDGEVTKEELDSKARKFASESLERLLDISRSVLERIEQELKKIEEPPADGAPKPEEKTI